MLRKFLGALKPGGANTPGNALARARTHYLAGEYADAEAAYARVVRHRPGDAGIWLELGMAQDRRRRSLDAARSFARAYTLDRSLADVGQVTMRAFDALGIDICADTAQDFVNEFAAANVALASENLDLARRHLQRSLTLRPDWPFTRQRLGCLEALAGDMAAAQHHFDVSGAHGMPPDEYIRLTPEFINALAENLPPSTAVQEHAAPPEAELLVFASCDPGYLERFGQTLLRSLQRNADLPFAIHLQVVNPDSRTSDLLAALPRGGALKEIQTSTTRWRFDSPDQAKTGYACSRLLALPDLLAQSHVPVLMLDMDLLCLRPLGPMLAEVKDCDVGLLRWSAQRWQIWDHISASVAWFEPTPSALRFTSLAANYVRAFMDRPGGAWYLDQIALFAALAHGGRHGLSAAFFGPQTCAQLQSINEVSGMRPIFGTVTANIGANASCLQSPLFRSFLS